jgi:mono/diheme cytochrome c family protein
MRGGLLLFALFVAVGCKQKAMFTEAQKLGGKDIPAQVLNEGYEAYMHNCYACHGAQGDTGRRCFRGT